MKRKTITIAGKAYVSLATARRPGETFSDAIERITDVKTNADLVAFYRKKTTWLAPRKIALIKRLRRARRRSLRA